MKHLILSIFAILLLQVSLATAFGAEPTTEDTPETASPENWTIEKIECVGNEITSCSIIENEIYLRAGDKVNEEQIENAQLRLKTLGLFYDVQLYLQKGTSRGQVILMAQVVERSRHYINFTGYSYLTGHSLETSSATIAVGDRNLFGLGKRLEVSAQKYLDQSTQSFNAVYEDPNIFGSPRYFASVNVSYYKSAYRETAVESTGLSLSIGRRIFDFSYIKLLAREANFNSRYSDQTEIHSHNLMGGIEYGWNTQDDVYFPTSGSTFALGAEVAKDNSYYYLNSSYAQGLNQDYNLLVDAFASYIQSDIAEFSYGNIGVTPAIAKYFSFHRQGERVADRMKIFAAVSASKSLDLNTIHLDPKAGVSYLIDSFGKIDFTLSFAGL